MTMMALTRQRHRALHLWALAAGLLLIALVAVGVRGERASAIVEGTVVFSVTQTPAAPQHVQIGLQVTFTVNATTTSVTGLLVDFDYPQGALTYVSGISNPIGVVCGDNSPSTGIVRCDYATTPPNTVPATTLAPLTLTFVVNGSFTTTPADFVVRSHPLDVLTDLASDGDDSTTGLGTLTVFSSSVIAAAGSGTPATVFEGATTTYTATLQNNSGATTGAFAGSVLFTNGSVTNIVCSHGSAGGLGGTSATCNNVNLADTETLTITSTVAASNTASGADITATVSAPALGISQPGSGVTVDELGLDFTGTTLAAGTPITVCTAAVPTDVANDAAAGAAQPGTGALIGQVSLNPLLTTADFQVSGPGVGAVTAAAGCGASQSGVTFTPSASGAYTVTALYNTGGTNVLALTVGGGAPNNPVPTASLLSPSSANAGSGAFTLTVTGTGFVDSVSVVRWNGVPLSTTFVSSTSLTAQVPAGNIASVGTANVTVFNTTPGGGTSSPLTFTINAAPNPVPTVSALAPNSANAGAAQFQLTVTGTNFVAGSVVRWNGADLATSYTSPTTLSATVPAANVATAGAANVTVFNPAPGGGLSVTPQVFTINAGAAKLAFTAQPGAGVAGSALESQPSVAVQTASNATVTSDSTTLVTLALNGTGTLTCTGGLSKTVTAGVATFAGCKVDQAGTGFTITATATSLTSATSATFDVSVAPPTPSTEVTVSNSSNAPIPRSRLSLGVSTGSLNASAVGLIVKRKADNKYWSAGTATWQTDLVIDAATHGTGSAWNLPVTGDDRRLFANTVITLEARVTVGSTVYVNTTIPQLTIR